MTRLARADRAGRLRFAPLQGATARRVLPEPLLTGPGGGPPPTAVLLEARGLALRSAAVLRTLAWLPWPWRAGAALWLVPRPLRDAVYDWVAAHRGRFSGGPGQEQAGLNAAQQARFLP